MMHTEEFVTKSVTARIDEKLVKEVDLFARQAKRSRSQIIEFALNAYLENAKESDEIVRRRSASASDFIIFDNPDDLIDDLNR